MTKRPWRVRPVHPVFRTRTYADESRADETARQLTARYGVSCEVLYGHRVMYEVVQLPGMESTMMNRGEAAAIVDAMAGVVLSGAPAIAPIEEDV